MLGSLILSDMSCGETNPGTSAEPSMTEHLGGWRVDDPDLALIFDERPSNPCAYCAAALPSGMEPLCPWHTEDHHLDGWAEENRIYCDKLHRKKDWTPVPEDKLATSVDFRGRPVPVSFRPWANEEVYEEDR